MVVSLDNSTWHFEAQSQEVNIQHVLVHTEALSSIRFEFPGKLLVSVYLINRLLILPFNWFLGFVVLLPS
jgi:hypothetical protein